MVYKSLYASTFTKRYKTTLNLNIHGDTGKVRSKIAPIMFNRNKNEID